MLPPTNTEVCHKSESLHGTVSLKDDVPRIVDIAQLVALAARSQATTHAHTSR